MSARDPRVEPRAGDWLSNGRADVRVDFTEGDSVFCVKWPAGIGAAWVFGEAIEVWRP